MRRPNPNRRRGATIVLICLLATFLCACVAFAVDVGYIALARSELQRTADAAALAGAQELYPFEGTASEIYSFYLEPDPVEVREEAREFAAKNGGGKLRANSNADTNATENHAEFVLNENTANAPDGDIVIGRIYAPNIQTEQLIPDEVSPNSVQVTARLADNHTNGSLSLFFSRVLGIDDTGVTATATASVIHASLLPFATSEDKWRTLATGGDGDNFTYDDGVISGGDGVPEIEIYPDLRWDGADLPPGNFGALAIGTNTSNAATLRRQIDQGPTASELNFHGNLSNGSIVSGQTGISATVKTAFEGGWDTSDLRHYSGIVGHPRYLPIYSTVTGVGTNSQFTIVKFVAVRVVDIDLKGKNKFVRMQPIPDTTNAMMNVRLTR